MTSLHTIDIKDSVTPEQILIRQEMVSCLSNVAKEMIFIALNAPSEMLKEYNEEPSLVKINQFLREKMKRKWSEILNARKEIKQMLRELN